MISRRLGVEKSIKQHLTGPIKVGIVMEEGRHKLSDANLIAVAAVVRKPLVHPRQHQCNVYAAEEAKFGRVDAARRGPELDGAVGEAEDSE
jgi:hypothetical protein